MKGNPSGILTSCMKTNRKVIWFGKGFQFEISDIRQERDRFNFEMVDQPKLKKDMQWIKGYDVGRILDPISKCSQ
jgi:hypothetical protein